MDCWSPVRIYNKGYTNVKKQLNNLYSLRDNPYKYVFGSSNHGAIYTPERLADLIDYYEVLLELTPSFVYAPCRKCPACLRKRSHEWKGRLIRECEYWRSSGVKILFCTFTYSDRYYKSASLKYKEHLAKFFDKFRSKYRRSLRHWCIPELGETTGRFHVHALLFDVPDDFAPDSHFHRSKNGAIMGSNKVIKKLWPYGINDVGFLKQLGGVTYLVGYLTKITDASLKANEGIPFKGGIVCSNKIGFLDYDEKQLFNMASKGESLSYEIGGYKFPYSYSLIRKVLNPIKLRYVSFINSLKSYYNGGEFVFNKRYYAVYQDYRDALVSAVSTTTYKKSLYQHSIDYSNYDIKVYENFYYDDLI